VRRPAVSPPPDVPPVLTRTRRTPPPRPVAKTPRDLAGAAEPAFVPARGDAAAATVRDRIATELVRAHDLSPKSLPPGESPDLDGSTVRVSSARLSSAPLLVTVPFAGIGWTAALQRAEWRAEDRATLIYELRRPARTVAEPF
jgi:hypothetical protein